MGDTKQNGRVIRVVEARYAKRLGGPWEEPRDEATTSVAPRDWDDPIEASSSRPGWYVQRRVVPYVPESELERYRAVVGEVLRVIELGASDRHARRCFLEELRRQGITKEGAVVK